MLNLLAIALSTCSPNLREQRLPGIDKAVILKEMRAAFPGSDDAGTASAWKEHGRYLIADTKKPASDETKKTKKEPAKLGRELVIKPVFDDYELMSKEFVLQKGVTTKVFFEQTTCKIVPKIEDNDGKIQEIVGLKTGEMVFSDKSTVTMVSNGKSLLTIKSNTNESVILEWVKDDKKTATVNFTLKKVPPAEPAIKTVILKDLKLHTHYFPREEPLGKVNVLLDKGERGSVATKQTTSKDGKLSLIVEDWSDKSPKQVKVADNEIVTVTTPSGDKFKVGLELSIRCATFNATNAKENIEFQITSTFDKKADTIVFELKFVPKTDDKLKAKPQK